MELRASERFPVAAERVGNLLADPDFNRAALTGPAASPDVIEGDAAVTCGDAGAFSVAIRRTMTARALPEHLRAYLPGGLDVRQVNAWDAPGPDGSRRGTVTMEMLGAPLTLRGTMTLTAEGEGACRLSYAVHLRASVPLVGAVIEEAAAPAIHAGIRAERDQLMARLIEDAGATEPGAA